MTTSLLAATTTPDPFGWLALAVLLFIAWRLLLVWRFPYTPCHRCEGTGKKRSGKYFRPCRRCDGTGRKIRLGRRVWDWTRSPDERRTRT